MEKRIAYVVEFGCCDDRTRPVVLKEFADNGVENLVLSDFVIGETMKNPTYAWKIKREMKDAGLKFFDAHAIYGPFNDLFLPPDGEYRRQMLINHKHAMEIAADFGCTNIVIHVGDDPFESVEGYDPADLQKYLIDSLEELLPFAEEYGVIIAIENAWYPANAPGKLIEAVEYFNSPYLGVCYDSGHANLMVNRNFPETPAVTFGWAKEPEIIWEDHCLEKLLPHIVVSHLHDNDGLRDYHRLAGHGNIDWKHTMQLLASAPRLQSYQCESGPIGNSMSVSQLCREFFALTTPYK